MAASWFTFSVRPFQVPAAPGTLAWPPSLPSVPTSRATRVTSEAKGEIAALADTINSMIETLATFAEQVTTVAREVGVEGQLGGQAKVPGASGTWKGLTENVNQLAENLTTQVRAIAEVATAVTQGDLTRSITVQAKGEVAALKDTINAVSYTHLTLPTILLV